MKSLRYASTIPGRRDLNLENWTHNLIEQWIVGQKKNTVEETDVQRAMIWSSSPNSLVANTQASGFSYNHTVFRQHWGLKIWVRVGVGQLCSNPGLHTSKPCDYEQII